MKRIVIGLLGNTLDSGWGPKRWENWRPTISLCMQEDLLVDEFHLLLQAKSKRTAQVLAEDIASVSPETKLVLHNVEFENPWDFEEVYGVLHDFCNGFNFEPESNEYLVHITTGTHVAQICLFLLTESRHLPGKLLQSSPTHDKTRSCAGTYTIIDLDLSRYDRIASRFREETDDDINFLKSGIETKNSAFNSLIEMIEKVAIRSQEPILLMGPTGAGKSHLASRIYELKRLKNQVKGRFVELNCATLRGDGAMSALFGHKRGSFTGAVSERPGLLKSGDGGIVFLDEIGELGLDEQTMLLRAIEEKRFTPLGSDSEVESDFQLICGTNRNLFSAVREGKFRDDLLARINLWTFKLPGLKDRPEDIEPNLDYELKKFEKKSGIHVTFNREARDCFLKFAVSSEGLWLSNFRDLNGAVTRMCTLAPGGRINLDTCRDELARLRDYWGGSEELETSPTPQPLPAGLDLETIDPFDLVQLEYAIEICRKSRTLSDAGRKLFCKSRLAKNRANDADRLRKYLARFGLSWDDLF